LIYSDFNENSSFCFFQKKSKSNIKRVKVFESWRVRSNINKLKRVWHAMLTSSSIFFFYLINKWQVNCFFYLNKRNDMLSVFVYDSLLRSWDLVTEKSMASFRTLKTYFSNFFSWKHTINILITSPDDS
jgi:hypothetical protein